MSTEIPFKDELWLALFALGGVLVSLVIHRIAAAISRRTNLTWDNVFVYILRGPTLPLGAAVGMYLGMAYKVPETSRLLNVDRLLVTLAVIWIALRASRVGIERLLVHRPGLFPVAGLIRATINITVLIIGILMVLDSVGIPIGPLLASLGVGSLAVALALQDTLANLFGGVYLAVGQPIRPGDFVKTEHGEEGTVVAVSWRSTELRTPGNALVIIPNAKLAQSVMINYSRPELRVGASVQVDVAYEHDPRQVIRILEEIGHAASHDLVGILAEPAPSARLVPGFGADGLQFTLSCNVASFNDQVPVQDELRLRIWERFRKEGIQFAHPLRLVHVAKG